MKVKEIPFADFKQALKECLKNGDFPKDVKDMELTEFETFLTNQLNERMKTVEKWLKQHE